MAKTSNKKTVDANPRSRAAKRATSPSINVDKSIKDAPRALGTSPMLGISRNSGIAKKKKTKVMTRGQRARQEKGLARAEVVMDQMEKKVDGAKDKLKKRNMRKALWDDVNNATTEEQRKTVRTPGREQTTEEKQDLEGEHNKETGEVEMDGTEPATGTAANVLAVSGSETRNNAVNHAPSHSLQQDEFDLIT